MPSKEAKWRKYMKEYREANKDKISADATSYSKEHDRTGYHRDYYANNLELSRIKSAKHKHKLVLL